MDLRMRQAISFENNSDVEYMAILLCEFSEYILHMPIDKGGIFR